MEEQKKTPLTEEELLKREQALESREEELNAKESKLQKMENTITRKKYNLYDRIDVSLGTMNKIIAVLVVLLILAVLAGIFMK